MFEEDNRKDCRVKLYHLEHDVGWVDVGTGNLVCCIAEDFNAPALILTSEDDSKQILLKSRIQFEDIYERQGDSIIMWRDRLPAGDEDYAVSFQNTNDCQAIWDAIGDIQSQYLQHKEYGVQPSFGKQSPINVNGHFCTTQTLSSSSSSPHRLPPVSKLNLAEIKFVLLNTSPFDKDSIVTRFIAREYEYLNELLQLFHELERTNDLASLNTLSDIWRTILMLNEGTMIQFALSDAFLTILGIFEYDSALRKRGNHREFFLHHAKLREVFPLNDESLRTSIHSLYRMKYIKDYLLRPSIDENGAAIIMTMMTGTAIDICTKVFENTDYLSKILSAIINPSIDETEPTAINASNDDLSPLERSVENLCVLGEVNEFNALSPSNSTCGVDGDDTHSEDSQDVIADELSLAMNNGSHSQTSKPKYRSREVHHVDQESAPSSPKSHRNLRLEGIRFLRELFFLSRNFHWDRRYDLYVSFLKRFQDQFFPFVCHVLNPSLSSSSFVTNFERQCVAEICVNIASICSVEIRKYILSDPLPPLPEYVQEMNLSSSSSKHRRLFPTSNNKANDNSNDISNQTKTNLLLAIIIGLLDGDDSSVIEYLFDILKYLIEPELLHRPAHGFDGQVNHIDHGHMSPTLHPSAMTSANNKQEYERFLTVFYDHYIQWLLIPFMETNEPYKPRLACTYTAFSQSTLPSSLSSSSLHTLEHAMMTGYSESLSVSSSPYPSKPSMDNLLSVLSTSRRFILDLLTICVYRHTYRMKYFVMRMGLLNRLNRFLLALNHGLNSPVIRRYFRYLQCHLIKFWKAIISTKDEFYHRHIIKLDLFQPLIQTLQQELQSLQLLSFASTVIATPSSKKSNRCQESLIISSMIDILLFISHHCPTLLVNLIEKHISPLQSELAKASLSVTTCLNEVIQHLHVKYNEIIQPKSLTGRVDDMESRGIGYEGADPLERARRKRNRAHQEHDREEAYFESDQDDDASINRDETPGTLNAIDSAATAPKDSLQLLAEFYQDYESDEDQTTHTLINPNQTNDITHDIAPISPTGHHSPLTSNGGLSEEFVEKRRQLAILRDLVDFGVRGTPQGMNASNHSPTNRPVSPNETLSPTVGNTSTSFFDGQVPKPSDSSLQDSPSFQLPPLKSKFEDDDTVTKEEFLARAAKYKALSNRVKENKVISSSGAANSDSTSDQTSTLHLSSSTSALHDLITLTSIDRPEELRGTVIDDTTERPLSKPISFSLTQKKRK